MTKKGGLAEDVFTRAKEGIFAELYEDNFATEEKRARFIPAGDLGGILASLWTSEEKTALYFVVESVESFKEYECRQGKNMSRKQMSLDPRQKF